ncbi:ribonuclease H-like domain-containing protein, partial [Tanacetum coccineum]
VLTLSSISVLMGDFEFLGTSDEVFKLSRHGIEHGLELRQKKKKRTNIVATSRYVVPTGRVKVPAGRYVVPTGKDNVIVSAGRTKVIPAGSTILVHSSYYDYSGLIVKSLPEDHMADFHHLDDARDIWLAVKARFGGNDESKKMRKSMLKQEFSEFRVSESEGLHKGYDRFQKILSQLNQMQPKPDNEDCNTFKFLKALPTLLVTGWLIHSSKQRVGSCILSFDDYTSKFRTLNDCKGCSSYDSRGTSAPTHSAFISAASTNSKMSYPDQSHSTTFTSTSSNHYEDFDQIGKLDLEELDIKWQMAMLSVRINRFEKKAGRKMKFNNKDAARFDKKKVKCYKCSELVTLLGNVQGNSWILKQGKEMETGAAHVIWDDSGAEEGCCCMATGDLLLVDLLLMMFHNAADEVCHHVMDEVFDPSAPSIFDTTPEDVAEKPLYDRFVKAVGMHDVPPPITGTFMPPSNNPDLDDTQVTYGSKSNNYFETNSVSNDFVLGRNIVDKSSDSETTGFASCVSSVKSSSSKTNEPLASAPIGMRTSIVHRCSRNRPHCFLLGSRNRPAMFLAGSGNSTNICSMMVDHISLGSMGNVDKPSDVILGEFKGTYAMGSKNNGGFIKYHGNRRIGCLCKFVDSWYVTFGGGDGKSLEKASKDFQTETWRIRMAHVNFKNMNKLAKHGLVNGLPSKLFTNEHNCVACNKGKQHKASYKTITAGLEGIIVMPEPHNKMGLLKERIEPHSVISPRLRQQELCLLTLSCLPCTQDTNIHAGSQDDSDSECDEQAYKQQAFEANAIAAKTVSSDLAASRNQGSCCEILQAILILLSFKTRVLIFSNGGHTPPSDTGHFLIPLHMIYLEIYFTCSEQEIKRDAKGYSGKDKACWWAHQVIGKKRALIMRGYCQLLELKLFRTILAFRLHIWEYTVYQRVCEEWLSVMGELKKKCMLPQPRVLNILISLKIVFKSYEEFVWSSSRTKGPDPDRFLMYLVDSFQGLIFKFAVFSGVAKRSLLVDILFPILGPSSDPNIASSSRPHESAPDLFTSTNVEDEIMGGSFHTSPPSVTLVLNVNTHELNSSNKLLFKEVVGKLVKRVKLLEDKLKGRKRKFVLTDSDKEEDVELDVDPLIKLAKAAATAAAAFAVPIGGSHEADILPSSSIPTDEFAGGSDVPAGATTGPSTVSPSSTTVPTPSSIPAAAPFPAGSGTTPESPSSPVRDARKGKRSFAVNELTQLRVDSKVS